MTPPRLILLFWLALSLPLYTACRSSGGAGDGADDPDEPCMVDCEPEEPEEPAKSGAAVSALEDQIVRSGDTVVLPSAVGSDVTISSYRWEQVSGSPTVTLTTPTTATSGFVAPVVGSVTVLTFRVTVTDNTGGTNSDLVTVTIHPAASSTSRVKAGAACADATSNLGGSSGQYARATNNQGSIHGGGRDPANPSFSTAKQGAYGIHSRITVCALVVEGNNNQRVALLKSDNYLAQDMLIRRVGQLLAAGTSGITYNQIVHSASHNHSSPYVFTQSPGLAVFQDAYDARMFELMARSMRDAIEQAVRRVKPARMGAHVMPHYVVKSNIMGPALANDASPSAGTPAGYPRDFGAL